MLEQGPDAREYVIETSTTTQGPLDIKFVLESDDGLSFIVLENQQIQASTTESSNISLFATSSMPFFDDETAKNRSYSKTQSRIIEID